jgi:proton glutamate symport protein
MKNKSFLFVLLAILLGAFIGYLTGPKGGICGITFYSIYTLIGTLFINALMMVVVPLVISSIITAISGIGNDGHMKSLGLTTFGFFLLTNLLAIIVGLLLFNLFFNQFAASAELISKMKNGALDLTIESTNHGLVDVVLRTIPSNIFQALTNGQMIGIIFFSLLFGYSLSKIEGTAQQVLINFWKGLFQVMIKITLLVIKFLPLGVFCLVAKEFAETGFQSLKSLGFFMSIVLFGLAIHFFITLPLLLRFVGRVSPLKLMKAMGKALITAFSTSSSSATIPVTLSCLEENVKVSNKVTSLTVPLGSSLNLSATAMYVIISSSFISMAYGITLSFTMQFTIFLLTFLTTLGVASVPSGCLVTTILVLKGIGVPASGIGLIIAVDRILDMFRTMTNVFSTTSSTVIVAKLQGEKLTIDK